MWRKHAGVALEDVKQVIKGRDTKKPHSHHRLSGTSSNNEWDTPGGQLPNINQAG